MIGISLNNNISCESVCSKIQQLVNSYAKENGGVENCILTINITKSIEGSLKINPLNLEYIDSKAPQNNIGLENKL